MSKQKKSAGLKGLRSISALAANSDLGQERNSIAHLAAAPKIA